MGYGLVPSERSTGKSMPGPWASRNLTNIPQRRGRALVPLSRGLVNPRQTADFLAKNRCFKHVMIGTHLQIDGGVHCDAALSARSLTAWADLTRGLKAGALAALDEAAERLQSQAQAITLPAPGTLSDAASVEAWLDGVRAAILAALAKGPVRPRF
jgi:hypothetical protein